MTVFENIYKKLMVYLCKKNLYHDRSTKIEKEDQALY